MTRSCYPDQRTLRFRRRSKGQRLLLSRPPKSSFLGSQLVLRDSAPGLPSQAMMVSTSVGRLCRLNSSSVALEMAGTEILSSPFAFPLLSRHHLLCDAY
ncbi:hypothetical protein U1Q18_026930 [Sarracenia purpurea var. burkii]